MSMGRRALITAVSVAVCVGLWAVPAIHRYFISMVKLQPMRLPLALGMAVLLALALLALGERVYPFRRLAVVGIGALVGQLACVVAISLANLFLPNGPGRYEASLREFGVLQLLTLDLLVAVALGGWCWGVIAFISYQELRRRQATR
jgi:hypothetical protein